MKLSEVALLLHIFSWLLYTFSQPITPHHSKLFKVNDENYHENWHPLFRATHHPPFVNFTNSEFVNKTFLANYSAEWKKFPIAIIAIADHNYIPGIQMFVESMTSFGFTVQDMIIFCMTSECVQRTNERIPALIQVYHYANANCEPSIRCTVGDSKFASILELLQYNITVYYFDLDIYFRRNPLPLVLDDSYEMYAQSNGETNRQPFNFGCLLARPTPKNIAVYKKSLKTFLDNPELFDQLVWNTEILSDKLPSYAFSKSLYYSISDRREDSKYPDISENFVMVHSTCIEG
jgi:hypothetical protein